MMPSLKQTVKNIFIRLDALPILDKVNYLSSRIKNHFKNSKYKKENPCFVFPPDYYLYETYTLNYQAYKEDGEITAKEIIEWTTKYIQDDLRILEWGCGVGRIIRHIPRTAGNNALITGADINEEMIKWNSSNISNVHFKKISYFPPTDFETGEFNLVFALSVFTHIESEFQTAWLAEIERIISRNGIFLFTTQGSKFDGNLGNLEIETLHNKGALTINYKQKGHRMMSTYNQYESFKITVKEHFEILEYYSGAQYPEKVGGQDLWIVRKNR